MEQSLYWDTIFEIVLALKDQYPDENLETVSVQTIYDWTIALPNFKGDPELANDEILMAIYQEWYEEINPL
jgi:FeS assembly protein IscX